jgi:hypothetical protein
MNEATRKFRWTEQQLRRVQKWTDISDNIRVLLYMYVTNVEQVDLLDEWRDEVLDTLSDVIDKVVESGQSA